MNLNKVEKLPPFKNFFATVGNIPSSYQESMTYFEMLQWFCDYLENTVIPTLNNNGQSVIELQNLFVELHDYVKNYFNNLDVQQEINNKLDTMASDGTLDQLLLPYFNAYKNEINNIIHSQNDYINNINDKVNSVASGSPLVASSISDMTDTTRTYVNTTNGHWYWYNGSSWVDGGVYQATEDSPTLTNLDYTINNLNFNLYNFSQNQNGYINDNDGTINNNNTYKYAITPVNPNNSYYLFRKSQKYMGKILFFDQNNVLISSSTISSNYTLFDKKYFNFTTPANCYFVAYNTKILAFNELYSSIITTVPTTSSLNAFDYNMNSLYNILKVPNIYDKSNLIYNKFINNLGVRDDARGSYCCQPVLPNTIYYLCRIPNNYYIDNDGIWLSNTENIDISNDTFIYFNNATKLNLDGNTMIKIKTNENTNFINFNTKLASFNAENSSFLLLYPTMLPILACDYFSRNFILDNYKKIINHSLLYDKKWLLLGDSITEKNFRSTKNYYEYISELYDMLPTNIAVSGTGYMNGGNNKIPYKIDSLNPDTEYDYITIFAGTNDLNYNLGAFSDTTIDSIYGSIRYCIEKLIEKHPLSKIALFTPLPRSSNYGKNNKLEQISNAIIEIGNNYSIPVLDLYHNSGLRPWNNNNNREFFSCSSAPNGDGLHPNAKGHLWISNIIKLFMESL